MLLCTCWKLFLKAGSIIKNTSLLQLLAIFVLASCDSSNNENDVPSARLLTVSDLTIDRVDNIFYPPFSADTRHYAASCGYGESFSAELASLSKEAQIHVND